MQRSRVDGLQAMLLVRLTTQTVSAASASSSSSSSSSAAAAAAAAEVAKLAAQSALLSAAMNYDALEELVHRYERNANRLIQPMCDVIN